MADSNPIPPEMSWDSESCGQFSHEDDDDSSEESIEDVIDLTLPAPPPKKKKLITEYLKPTSGLSRSGGIPYFLQRFDLQPATNSGSSKGQPSIQQSSSEESGTSKATTKGKKGEGTRSVVNKTYTLARKFEVLQYVSKFSESEASCHFGIPRTTIQGWKGLDKQPNKKKSLKKKGKNKCGAGRPITYGEDLDMALYQWILEMRDLNMPVQNSRIKQKAIEIIQPTNPSFKASAGWLTRFKTRHSLVLRRQTSVQQKLPAQLETKLSRFLEDLKAIRLQHKFDKSLIINMDETPMCFDMPSNTTIDVCGKKEILVRGTGAHKRRFTVTLACTASGEMLKPFVTFKAKTDRVLKKMNYSERDIIVTNQPKGWMDSNLMHPWIRKVLVKYTKGRHALLVFDTFKDHLTEDVLTRLKDNNITVVIIPGGCTSKVQPLDVSLNKPFKAFVCGAWEEYMLHEAQASTNHTITTASRDEIVQWIVNACLHEQGQMIAKAFLVCGISNKVDGSENHLFRVPEELWDQQ